MFIFACIILISTGGGESSDDVKTPEDSRKHLYFSVILALLAGIGLSVNTLNVEYIIKKVGFPTNQINVDGNFTYGLVFLPLFILEMRKEEATYTFREALQANLSILCIYLSTNCFLYAMKYGKGGIVQAIMNSNILIQTLLSIIFTGLIPTAQQIIGMGSGIVGMLIIILSE